MAKPRKRPIPSLILGALPVEMIKATIGLDLPPGEVVFSRAAQKHAEKRHPKDYPLCLPHMGGLVLSPLYIGDDHRNAGIELVGRIPNGNMLIAVCIEPDKDGQYPVCSVYMVTEKKIQGRRQRGFLKVARLK